MFISYVYLYTEKVVTSTDVTRHHQKVLVLRAAVGREMKHLVVKLRQNCPFLTKVEPSRFVFIEVLHSLEISTPEENEKHVRAVTNLKRHRLLCRTGVIFLKN